LYPNLKVRKIKKVCTKEISRVVIDDRKIPDYDTGYRCVEKQGEKEGVVFRKQGKREKTAKNQTYREGGPAKEVKRDLKYGKTKTKTI